MQGDPKVDELMRPVLAAIKRHVKDREAATEIYNRAYEAVMNSVDVKPAACRACVRRIVAAQQSNEVRRDYDNR